jgi:hypothetical protein
MAGNLTLEVVQNLKLPLRSAAIVVVLSYKGYQSQTLGE